MVDHDESDSAYIRERVEGYLLGLARSSDEDLAFDQERWEDQYGDRVVYDSFPAWASEGERKRNEEPVVMCDWKESTETLYLKDDVCLPLNRTGEIVFEDGTVVIVSSNNPQMFTVDEVDIERIERWREAMLSLLREAYEKGAK